MRPWSRPLGAGEPQKPAPDRVEACEAQRECREACPDLEGKQNPEGVRHWSYGLLVVGDSEPFEFNVQ